MTEPTEEQMEQAIRLIDEHLASCEEDDCPGLNEQLAKIHPSLMVVE